MKFNLIIITLITCINIFSQDTFTTIRTGSWDDSTSAVPSATTPWSYTGSDADGIPDEDDIVVIGVGHTVTLPSGNTRVKNLTLDGNLDIPSSSKLYLWSDVGASSLVLNGNITGSGEVVTVSYNSVMSGGGSVGASIDLWVANLFTIDGMIIEFANQVKIQGVKFNIINGANVTFSGNVFTTSSLCRFQNQATITVNTTNFFSSGPTTSQVLRCNYPNTTLILNSNIDIPIPWDNYVNLTINSSTTCTSDFSLTGNLLNNGTINFTGTPTITFNGTTSQLISGSGTSNLHNLTLNNSNGLSLNSGTINISNALTSISGTITQNGANLTLVSNSANSAGLIKLNTASDYSYSSGDFTVQRYYNGTQDGWRMVASPIKSATLADWDDEFIYCGISGGTGNYSYSGCGGFYSVYEYDESAAVGNIDDGLSEVTSLGFGVSNATGTLIYTSSGATTLSVTGTPEFDDIAKSVTRNNAGWNLVANPYPSTIDWLAFTTENSNITGNVWYTYSADAVNYVTNASDIPHSQGFWINSSSSTNLNFSVSETKADQATFYKSTNGINLPLKLKLTNDVNSYFDFAYLKTGPNFSNDFESDADALKLFTPYPDYNANIYFLDNQGNTLDRSSINNNYSEDIFFDVKVGPFVSGNYTIQFENLDQFMIGSCLQLEDLHSGIITDLRQDSIYTFASDTNAPSPRFKLQITVDYDINVSNAMCYNDSSAFVSIKGTNLQSHYFNLIDTSGLLIDSVVAVSDSILFGGLNAGVFRYETNHIGNCPTQNQLIYVTEPQEVISLFSTISDTFYLDTSNQIPINFRNLSTGSTYYEWDFGDGTSSFEENPTHTYNNSGIYTVILTVSNDSTGICSSNFSSSIIVLDSVTLVNNLNFVSDLIISQNEDFIEISLQNDFDESNLIECIVIYDLYGRFVEQKPFLNSNKVYLRKFNSTSQMYLFVVTLNSGISLNKKFFMQ